MIGLYSLFVLIGLLTFWGASHLIAAAMGAPTVSSRREVAQEALKLAGAKPGERFLDLGCGWGITLKIAKERGLDAEGIEISPTAWFWNRIMGRQVRFGNLLNADVRSFDIIYIYLLPNLIKKLKLKIKNGARIIAVDFPIPHRKPTKTKKVGRHTIYLYGQPRKTHRITQKRRTTS